VIAGAGTVRTARLLLRKPGPADAGTIARLANNRLVVEKLASLPFPYTLADAQEWIAATAAWGPEKRVYVIALLPDARRVMGSVGFGPFQGHPCPHLGFWLGQPYWGHGYAGEAARAAVEVAFGTCRLPMLETGCRRDNPASRRILVQLGFAPAGAMTVHSRALGREIEVERFRLRRSDGTP
jgi:RimJ/RimL family protein N-acetyltransferase